MLNQLQTPLLNPQGFQGQAGAYAYQQGPAFGQQHPFVQQGQPFFQQGQPYIQAGQPFVQQSQFSYGQPGQLLHHKDSLTLSKVNLSCNKENPSLKKVRSLFNQVNLDLRGNLSNLNSLRVQ